MDRIRTFCGLIWKECEGFYEKKRWEIFGLTQKFAWFFTKTQDCVGFYEKSWWEILSFTWEQEFRVSQVYYCSN